MRRSPLRFDLRMSIVLILALFTLQYASADYQISRDDLLQQINNRLKIASRLDQTLSENDRQRLLQQVRNQLSVVARQELPETISGSSQEDVNESMPTIIIKYNNDEFNRLFVQKSLMDVKLTQT